MLYHYLLFSVKNLIITKFIESWDNFWCRWLTNTLWYWSLIKHPLFVTVQPRDLSRALPVTSWYYWYSSLQDAFCFGRLEQLDPLQVSLRLNDWLAVKGSKRKEKLIHFTSRGVITSIIGKEISYVFYIWLIIAISKFWSKGVSKLGSFYHQMVGSSWICVHDAFGKFHF